MESPQWPMCALCLEPSWFPCEWISELHKENHSDITSCSEKWTMNCQQSTICCCECLQNHLKFLYTDRKKPQLLRCLLCPQSMSLPPLKETQPIPYNKFIQPNWILMKVDCVIYKCKEVLNKTNHNRECLFEGTQFEIFQHHIDCIDRKVECLFCGEFVVKKDVESKEHLSQCSQCRPCPECLEYIPKKNIVSHMKSVHERIACSWCKCFIIESMMERHRKLRCPRRHEIVMCPCTPTCNGRLHLCDLGQHYQDKHLQPLKELESMYTNIIQHLESESTLVSIPLPFKKRQKRWLSKTIEDVQFEQRFILKKIDDWS